MVLSSRKEVTTSCYLSMSVHVRRNPERAHTKWISAETASNRMETPSIPQTASNFRTYSVNSEGQAFTAVEERCSRPNLVRAQMNYRRIESFNGRPSQVANTRHLPECGGGFRKGRCSNAVERQRLLEIKCRAPRLMMRATTSNGFDSAQCRR